MMRRIAAALTFLSCNPNSDILSVALTAVKNYATLCRLSTALRANPINSDGSKYRGDITEEEAFLWFDEAMVSRMKAHHVPPVTIIRIIDRTAQHSELAQVIDTLRGCRQFGLNVSPQCSHHFS